MSILTINHSKVMTRKAKNFICIHKARFLDKRLDKISDFCTQVFSYLVLHVELCPLLDEQLCHFKQV